MSKKKKITSTCPSRCHNKRAFVFDGQRYETKAKVFRRSLLKWYAIEGRTFPWRNKTATKYKQIIAEMLLQRTKAETVSHYYEEFVRRYPSWAAISNENTKKIASFLKPIGLWKRRAISIKSAADKLSNNRYPKSREELEGIGGIGQYIANAILLACHGRPEPLLDVNMARVLERVFGRRRFVDIRYDPYLQNLSRAIVTGKDPKAVNWAILDLAALVCKAHDPACNKCPMRSICKHCQEKRVQSHRKGALSSSMNTI